MSNGNTSFYGFAKKFCDKLIIRYEEAVLSKIDIFILQLIDSLLKYNVVYT